MKIVQLKLFFCLQSWFHRGLRSFPLFNSTLSYYFLRFRSQQKALWLNSSFFWEVDSDATTNDYFEGKWRYFLYSHSSVAIKAFFCRCQLAVLKLTQIVFWVSSKCLHISLLSIYFIEKTFCRHYFIVGGFSGR